MNRILFWAVIAFALGEVAFLYAGRLFCVSMVFAMLIFCVIMYIRKHSCASFLLCISMMFLIGILNVSIRRDKPYFMSDIYNNELVLYGHVLDISNNSSGAYAEVLVYQTNLNKEILTDRYKIIAYKIPDNISMGQWIKLEGMLIKYDNASNPGGFDMYAYYMSDGIYAYMSDYDIDVNVCLKSKQTKLQKCWWQYKNTLANIKQELSYRLDSVCDENTSDLYKGILLGEKNEIDENTKELYKINGISHVLAISGLHISIIGGLLYKLLRKTGCPFIVSGSISLFITFSYGLMTGFSMATLRAFVMFCIYILSQVLGKRYDMQTAIAIALFVILFIHPYKIFDAGTIISCVAMIGVCTGQYVVKIFDIKKYIKRFKKRRKFIYRILKNLLFSICVNVVLLPVIIQIYYEFSLFSVVLNMFVMPTMSLLVITGLISMMLSFFSISVACVVAHIGKIIFWMYGMLCKIVVEVPFSIINPGRLNKYIVIVYYLFVVLGFILLFEDVQERIRQMMYRRYKIWFDYKKWGKFMAVLLSSYVITAFCVIASIYIIMSKEMIVFLDVGQGDGILIKTRSGINMVIDGGSGDEAEVGKYTLVPAIKYIGMANVDYWFVTHTDTDHINGLVYILEQGDVSMINIRNIVFSKYVVKDEQFERLIALTEKNKINIMYMDVHDYITDGTFNMMCCHPDKKYIYKDKNDASLALSYHSGELDVILLGDMGVEAEINMLNNSYIQGEGYDVIKIGHHGSKYSTSEELLQCISPRYAVVSVGENNVYGHPHKDVLERLEDVKSRAFLTSEAGAVVIENKKSVKIYGYKNIGKN